MPPWDAANAAIFRRLGEPALYRPQGEGAGLPVTVARASPDRDAPVFGTRLRVATAILHVQIAEVAAVMKGDTFTIGAEVLTAAADGEADAQRSMLTVEC